jgi:hypothetical protein
MNSLNNASFDRNVPCEIISVEIRGNYQSLAIASAEVIGYNLGTPSIDHEMPRPVTKQDPRA